MKKLLTTLFVALLGTAFAQESQRGPAYYKARAENNLKYLSNDFQINKMVQIDNKGIIIYEDFNRKYKDLALYWPDLPKFVDIVENWDYYEMVSTFALKKGKAFVGGNYGDFHYYKENPSSFDGLRVCLDPGHFGGNLQEAMYEQRYVRMRGEDLGQKEDIEFYEADLAYMVSLILKEKLENLGAFVMITRPYHTSAINKPFSVWFEQDFRKDLDLAYKKGDVNAELYKILSDSNVSERVVFDKFYKFLEFRARASKIAEFRPDITFAIHFNAAENNRRFGNRYLAPVEENYNMAFIPGAFLANELVKTDQKVDFIRLLVSQDIENSMRMADLVMQKHEEILGVKRIPFDNDIKVLRENSIASPFEGVYSRNLYITRSTRGIVVYGESLIQDNKEEALALSKKDFSFFDPNLGPLKTSSRVAQVAEAYFQALEQFLTENKDKEKMTKN